jgi:hypothetical protein
MEASYQPFEPHFFPFYYYQYTKPAKNQFSGRTIQAIRCYLFSFSLFQSKKEKRISAPILAASPRKPSFLKIIKPRAIAKFY